MKTQLKSQFDFNLILRVTKSFFLLLVFNLIDHIAYTHLIVNG